MWLDIDALEIEGFKSFNSLVRLDLKAYGQGLQFLRGRNLFEPQLGSNGSAKSSLWDACAWCFYGRTPDGSRTPDIIPWERKVTTRVQVHVHIGNKTHLITREANPNAILLNGKATDDTQIEKLLRMNFDVFCHTILLGQGEDLFFDLPPRNKLKLFNSVLGLERWNQRSVRAANRVEHLQQEANALSLEVSNHNTRLEQIKEQTNKIKQTSEEWENQRQQIVETADDNLKVLRGKLEDITLKHGEVTLALDGSLLELRPLQKQIRQLVDERNKVVSDHKTGKTVLANEMKRISDELKVLSDVDICPTCGQSLKGTGLEKHKKELAIKLNKLQKQQKSDTLRDYIDDLQKQIDTLIKAESKFVEKSEVAQTQLNLISPQLGEVQEKIRGLESIQRERRDTANPYQQQLFDLRRDQSQLIADRKEAVNKLKVLNLRIERTNYWVRGFKDVRLYIIEEVLQELELATNAMLGDIGLNDWQVHYAIEKETKAGTIQRGLNVLILSPKNKKLVRFESWSGGEAQRLRLVGALALGEVLLNHAGIQSGIEILDEPFTYLSKKGRYDAVNFLSTRAAELQKQIWLVDHSVIESTKFTNTLTVIKDKNGSYLDD